MLYGLEVNRAYLKAMTEFLDVPIEKITTADMARVAKSLKTKYQDQAQKRQAELKGLYGTGVCVLVRIYNATGGTLVLKDTADFRGHLGSQAIEHRILNGTWAVFIHVKTEAAAKGSAGAVVYKNDQNNEFFMGKQIPGTELTTRRSSWVSNQLITGGPSRPRTTCFGLSTIATVIFARPRT
ncbi:hypothetical protein B0H19DRAFT_711763 [Mycena capillaripes]|nr:hypothetical protein B0H19DRAFT_711763 [Mycena capillaripes]